MGMALRVALICAVAVVASAAAADYDPTQYPAYETCALCHGLFGVSHTAKFPNLGGQKPAYIEAQLRAFLSGDRSNDGGQMSAIVTELHPQDIPLVVEWFSSQDSPAPYEADATDQGAATFADLGCAGCHDNAPDGPADVPYLSSQHPGYLLKQMQDYRDGRRAKPEVAALHQSALSLPDTALEEIAAYLGALERP